MTDTEHQVIGITWKYKQDADEVKSRRRILDDRDQTIPRLVKIECLDDKEWILSMDFIGTIGVLWRKFPSLESVQKELDWIIRNIQDQTSDRIEVRAFWEGISRYENGEVYHNQWQRGTRHYYSHLAGWKVGKIRRKLLIADREEKEAKQAREGTEQ